MSFNFEQLRKDQYSKYTDFLTIIRRAANNAPDMEISKL